MQRPRKPADAFGIGERLHFDGRNWTVIRRRYLEERRSVDLALEDDDGKGKNWTFSSGDYLETGDELSLWRRLRRRLHR